MAKDLLPCKEMRGVLLAAYEPCPSFKGDCVTMRWQPDRGHVPRGFCGALGKPQGVGLVLIVAEPGDPHGGESYSAKTTAEELLSKTTQYAYQCYESGKDLFHRNVRYILDLFWPGMTFSEQMRRTWITESVLCSAKMEGGSVPEQASQSCVDRYLRPQLRILNDCSILALGRKAERRTSGMPNVTPVAAAAPPGCNRRGAKESWIKAADEFRKRMKPSATKLRKGK